MRILLEEVVFDLPGEIDADAVGELNLIERLAEQFQFVAVVPGTRQLVLVEDSEAHDGSPIMEMYWLAKLSSGFAGRAQLRDGVGKRVVQHPDIAGIAY